MRLRRTELAVPGNNERRIRKALLELPADEVFLDLEDAVPPEEKPKARELIANMLKGIGRVKGKTVAVRINGLSTKWWLDDLNVVIGEAGEYIDCVIVPKVEGSTDVIVIEKVLEALEAKKGIERKIGIEAQIESSRGLAKAEEIAFSSSRLESLIFGPLDYAADTNVSASKDESFDNLAWYYPMYRVNNAAKSARIQAIDGPYFKIGDLKGLEQSASMARRLGYDGKWVIHPEQIETCNRVFTPSKEEIERAKRILAEYRKAAEQGIGALTLEGEMIDAATVRVAERVLRIAEMAGLA